MIENKRSNKEGFYVSSNYLKKKAELLKKELGILVDEAYGANAIIHAKELGATVCLPTRAESVRVLSTSTKSP